MKSQPDKRKPNRRDKPNRKLTLTISTLSGADYTHAFKRNQQLQDVVRGTLKKLKLAGEGPWILEHKGSFVSLQQTISEAGLRDGDVLTLKPQGG
jgi:hypothetical protein